MVRACPGGEELETETLLARLRVRGAPEVPGYQGGTREAVRRLRTFVRERLPRYATERNQPTPYITSELSAHLHFGQISPIYDRAGRARRAAHRASASTFTWKN